MISFTLFHNIPPWSWVISMIMLLLGPGLTWAQLSWDDPPHHWHDPAPSRTHSAYEVCDGHTWPSISSLPVSSGHTLPSGHSSPPRTPARITLLAVTMSSTSSVSSLLLVLVSRSVRVSAVSWTDIFPGLQPYEVIKLIKFIVRAAFFVIQSTIMALFGSFCTKFTFYFYKQKCFMHFINHKISHFQTFLKARANN